MQKAAKCNAMFIRALRGAAQGNGSEVGLCIGWVRAGDKIWICGDRSRNIAMLTQAVVQDDLTMRFVIPFEVRSSLKVFASALEEMGEEGLSIFGFTAHVVYCRWEQGLEQLSNPIDPGHDVHDLEDFKPPRGKARPRPKAALADGPVEEDAKGDDDRDDDEPSAEELLREEAEPTETDLFEHRG